jgi:hypothetical protein
VVSTITRSLVSAAKTARRAETSAATAGFEVQVGHYSLHPAVFDVVVEGENHISGRDAIGLGDPGAADCRIAQKLSEKSHYKHRCALPQRQASLATNQPEHCYFYRTDGDEDSR